MTYNPYQPPSSAVDGPQVGSDARLSARVIESLGKTRPWVLLMTVLGFVVAGVFALFGVALLFDDETKVRSIGWIYVGMGSVSLGVAITTRRYSAAIKQLLHGGGVAELEQAMDAQAKVWRVAGILTTIGVVLVVLAIIVAVVIGVVLARVF